MDGLPNGQAKGPTGVKGPWSYAEQWMFLLETQKAQSKLGISWSCVLCSWSRTKSFHIKHFWSLASYGCAKGPLCHNPSMPTVRKNILQRQSITVDNFILSSCSLKMILNNVNCSQSVVKIGRTASIVLKWKNSIINSKQIGVTKLYSSTAFNMTKLIWLFSFSFICSILWCTHERSNPRLDVPVLWPGLLWT